MTITLSEHDSKAPPLGILDIVSSKLLLAHIGTGTGIVILRVDNGASLVAGEVGDNVAPAFVVVDAESDDEVLAVVSSEADGTRGAATAHGEDLLAVGLGPGATIGVVPDGLFNDVEEGGRVG